MPQEIRVLQCSKCQMYQVDIVKVAKKWQCKMCGIKQAPQTEYFRGVAAECRRKAQALNMARGKQEQQEADIALKLLTNDDDLELTPRTQLELPKQAECTHPSTSHGKSKWSYVEATEQATNEPEKEKQTKDAQFQMFKFSSTQQWSGSGRSTTKDLKRTITSDRPTEPKKKCSKWEEFV